MYVAEFFIIFIFYNIQVLYLCWHGLVHKKPCKVNLWVPTNIYISRGKELKPIYEHFMRILLLIVDLFQFLWSKQLPAFVSSSFTEHSVFIFLQLREWVLVLQLFVSLCFQALKWFIHGKLQCLNSFKGIHKFFWKIHVEIYEIKGTQQLFSVNYLFREENIIQDFLLLEEG